MLGYKCCEALIESGADVSSIFTIPRSFSINYKKAGKEKSQVYDRISSVIIEEVNKDHLLVRGRKDVIFRKMKRYVEVQALINKRDISDEDAIESTKILESSVTILR